MTLAIIFDSVGAGEWLVLLAVLLVVMGPRRLPSTARKIGQYYSKFRRAADSFKRQIMEMDMELEREVRASVDIPDITEPAAEPAAGEPAVSETGDPLTEPEGADPSAMSAGEGGEVASEFAHGNKFD